MRRLAALAAAVLAGFLVTLACQDGPTAPEASEIQPSFASYPTALSSTFDDDGENWTIFGDAESALGKNGFWNIFPQYVAADGNPEGAIFADDDIQGIGWWFRAPEKFLGNKLGMYGGELRYELKTVVSAPRPPDVGGPSVLLAGSGLTLVVALGSDPVPNVWTSFAVGLDGDAGWRLNRLGGTPATAAQVRKVLRNLVALEIRGEFYAGNDRAGLDNVRYVPKGQVDN
jgi:alkaline phosphatase D